MGRYKEAKIYKMSAPGFDTAIRIHGHGKIQGSKDLQDECSRF